MSKTWPGGLIRKTPVTPAGPLQNGAAPGIWSLAEASYWTKQGLWPIAGNFLAVEDVFSTWLYTGNGSTQTITNGIDLAGKGGLVWMKSRSTAGDHHVLTDTVTGATKQLASNLTDQQYTYSGFGLTSFGSTGFTLTDNSTGSYYVNGSSKTYVSWTFREAANFFDVVTWTGNGAASRNIPHNLGVAPGCIIVKDTSVADSWYVFHRSMSATPQSSAMTLNSTGAAFSSSGPWADTSPTSTQFTVGATSNTNGDTYVAYLFAHDASSDGIIQCGSFTTNGSGNATVNLGWEPQWLLMKNANGTNYNWVLMDQMRGWTASSSEASLYPNTSGAETVQAFGAPTATGFTASGWYATQDIIYIAIRRGPMRTPTSGTSVFTPVAAGNNVTVSGTLGFTTNIVTDLLIRKGRASGTNGLVGDRLRGGTLSLSTNTTSAEVATSWDFDSNIGVNLDAVSNQSGLCGWAFRRAPSFFDEVCYTGTGASTRSLSHNLTVVPQLMIIKGRNNSTDNWTVQFSDGSNYAFLYGTDPVLDPGLNSSAQSFAASSGNIPLGTTSQFYAGEGQLAFGVNKSGVNYVAYLFASCPGVSKVGSYTGTGALQTINCGFTTGARFVLIKRTDSTGDWFVWDSARGITSGNDPYLLLNSTAAEVTGTNYVDTTSVGFQVTAAAPAGINANGGSYIFLAVA